MSTASPKATMLVRPKSRSNSRRAAARSASVASRTSTGGSSRYGLRVQVVCSRKPYLELPPVLVREATDADRAAARRLFDRDFGRTSIVAFGEAVDIDQMPAL